MLSKAGRNDNDIEDQTKANVLPIVLEIGALFVPTKRQMNDRSSHPPPTRIVYAIQITFRRGAGSPPYFW
jgi:hypothetical protein